MQETLLEEAKQEEERLRDLHRKAREKLETLENKRRAESEEPYKKLAIKLHGAFCRWNHTDGCSWGYEESGKEHNWTGWAHARWLKNVHDIAKGSDGTKPIPVEALDALADAVIKLKDIHPDVLWLIRYKIEP